MPTGTITPGRVRKKARAPLTDPEKERVVELYRGGEHSLRDIAEQFDSNPSSISRIIHDAGVPMRAPGPSEIQRRNQQRRMVARAEQARALATYEDNIKAAVPKPRVRAADRLIAGDNPLAAQARAALHQEGRPSLSDQIQSEAEYDERHFDDIVEQGMEEETHTVTWTPLTERADPQAFNDALGRVEEDVKGMGSFAVTYPEGTLQWTRSGDQPFFPPEKGPTLEDLPTDTGWKPMPEQSQQELQRQHAAEQLRWESGVSFGYERATNDVTRLVDHLLADRREFGAANEYVRTALFRVVELLGNGEHFYQARRDPKPWNRAENWKT